ncbi:hypothetical protein ILYODFUR_019892 [Ilyodon furcidens]|uniref:Uncharacterized protein n=1 Tax=Ilyodon furcidens TaxID=33524 RepID=A0ABV0VGY9_9TELE
MFFLLHFAFLFVSSIFSSTLVILSFFLSFLSFIACPNFLPADNAANCRNICHKFIVNFPKFNFYEQTEMTDSCGKSNLNYLVSPENCAGTLFKEQFAAIKEP